MTWRDVYNQFTKVAVDNCLKVLANSLDMPVVLEYATRLQGCPALTDELVHTALR